MAEPSDTRVAVYIDFDNIVISRYDQLHGRGRFHRDGARSGSEAGSGVASKLEDATVDLGAVLDFASSFGGIAISRAYADWSVGVNASYRKQLVERAVDLVQMFPTVASLKNGADIRLAVDVVEDLFRLPELTHVVIVAGDSDYIALAQRCKRLGRYVVGVGVAGGTSKALAAACNKFADYDSLPGLELAERSEREPDEHETAESGTAEPARSVEPSPTEPEPTAQEPTEQETTGHETTGQDTAERGTTSRSPKASPVGSKAATRLLVKALELAQANNDDEWQGSSAIKNQMLRMDPTFQERALGFRSFSEFLKARNSVVEVDEATPGRLIRLRSKRTS